MQMEMGQYENLWSFETINTSGTACFQKQLFLKSNWQQKMQPMRYFKKLFSNSENFLNSQSYLTDSPPITTMPHKKMKFSIKDFFSKYDQILRKLRIYHI